MKFATSALAKALVVAFVALLVLVPVQLLESLVGERAQKCARKRWTASREAGAGGK